MRLYLLGVIFISFLLGQIDGFDPNKYRNRQITAIRIDEPLNIDGVLDEPLYSTKANGPLIQYEPNNGVPGSEETEIWVGYDDNAIYIGAMMYDSNPDSIVARMSRRDGSETSDLLYMVIDSYYDRRSGFWFGINPVGSIEDGTVSNDNNFDDSWDGIWDGYGRINENGWSSEAKIPFSQLRFNKADENIMGIGFRRRIHRREEIDFFMYLPRGESGMVSHFSILKGIQNIKPPKRLELTPYITGNYGFLQTEDDNPFYNGTDATLNIGTDLKVGIGNNLTVDATINPDFGQVEVDPSVINLSAFETFFQEKRPFFIEGANIFRFGGGGATNNMNFGTMRPSFFYSRRIGKYPSYGHDVDGDWVKVPSATTILGAGKLSGKITDTWSIGAFSAITKREFADVQIDHANSEVEVEPLTSYNLVRSLKEFNEGRQGLGFIATHVERSFDDETLREILSDRSTVLGIDGWTFLNQDKDWVIGGWLGYSNIQGTKEFISDLQQSSSRYYQRPDADHIEYDPDRTSLEGFAGKASINKETGNWNFNAAVQFLSPGFENNDMGLNFRADKINKHISFGYEWLEPSKYFQYAEINTAYMTNHNLAWDKTNEMFFLFGFARFKNYWSMGPIIGVKPRTISDETLRGGPLVISPSGLWSRVFARTDSRKPLIFELFNVYEKFEEEYSWRFAGEVEMNIGTRLRIEFEPGYNTQFEINQYVDSFDDETAEAMLGCRHIVAQMERKTLSAELRLDYTFTPKLSFQAYFQPYMTIGTFSRFKEFAKPESYDFVEYGKNNNMEIEADGDDGYYLYPVGKDGHQFYIDNPDFNYKALVGSAVLRWEFRPGSTLYLVWTRNGSDDSNPGNLDFSRDIKDMFNADADNVFALKLSYWLGR